MTGLQKTVQAVVDEGYDIASYIVDLADRPAVYAAAEKVKKEVGTFINYVLAHTSINQSIVIHF